MGHVCESADADVAVVGYGPTGMTLAALLGRYGHRVVVLERYPGLYHLPRAGVFDDETMRTWGVLGIAENLLPRVATTAAYHFYNGAGQLLNEFEMAAVGRSGWAELYGFFQPDLEAALDRTCRAVSGVEIRQGARVTGITQSDAGAEVTATGGAGPTRVMARYVIGCDGGESFVRTNLGIDQDDYGFGEPWLVCDFALRCAAR